MKAHISLLALGVSDLERAFAFYREGLGLAVRDRQHGIGRLCQSERHLEATRSTMPARHRTVPLGGS
jgi:catechol 2,3-dioxygenase-like lactoylglutathione lyase family enzyme